MGAFLLAITMATGCANVVDGEDAEFISESPEEAVAGGETGAGGETAVALTADGRAEMRCTTLSVRAGSIGADQTAAGLGVAEATPTVRSSFVEFSGGSRVVCTYPVPSAVASATDVSLSLAVSYAGPVKRDARWLWEVWDRSAQRWVYVGDNAFASGGGWSRSSTVLPAPVQRFFGGTGLWIRYRTRNKSSASSLDLMTVQALIAGTGGAGTGGAGTGGAGTGGAGTGGAGTGGAGTGGAGTGGAGTGGAGAGGAGTGGAGTGGAGTGGAGTGGAGTGGAGTGGAGTGGAGAGGEGPLFLDGFFPIGAYLVPPWDGHMEKWQARGVNTLVSEAGNDIFAWDQHARSLGLKMIRHPLPNPADDIGRTDLLAWMQDDEPDAGGQGNTNLPICQQRYADWKSVDPSRPVYINFGGSDVMDARESAPGCSDCLLISMYKNLIQTGDWISNDRYPVTGYLNEPLRRYDLTLIGEPVDRLRSWADKPQFNYVETSNQDFIPGARGVTPDELRAEIWLSIVHGVRGFVYFPEVVSGPNFGWDGTPPDVAAEMTKQNAIITSLARVLQGPIDPVGIRATAPSPLRVAWRQAPSGKYFIVVNPVATPINASIALTVPGTPTSATVYRESRTVPVSNGTLVDAFGPFAVHIYVVP